MDIRGDCYWQMRFKNEYILVNLPFRHPFTWNPISPYYPDEQICLLQPQKYIYKYIDGRKINKYNFLQDEIIPSRHVN